MTVPAAAAAATSASSAASAPSLPSVRPDPNPNPSSPPPAAGDAGPDRLPSAQPPTSHTFSNASDSASLGSPTGTSGCRLSQRARTRRELCPRRRGGRRRPRARAGATRRARKGRHEPVARPRGASAAATPPPPPAWPGGASCAAAAGRRTAAAKCPTASRRPRLPATRPESRSWYHDGLLRDVPVPDQEVLRERDVGPERREREEQLAEVVQVLGADTAGRGGPERRSDDRGEREEGEARDAASPTKE